MSSRDAAKEAIKKRNIGKSSLGKPTASGSNSSGTGELRLFSDDAPGLKISPQTVLIISLVYVGIVVLLHIWSKIRQDKPASTNQ